MKKLTIFTPTYNRANLLLRLYNSLSNQTCKEFEWIIIDDDSSDNTDSVINDILLLENEFEIYYFKQKHGGKHRAINRALEIAKNDYFFIVDSDDYLLENAVENILKWIDDTFAFNKNELIAGVAGLRANKEGIIGGMPFCGKNEYIDCNNFDRKQFNLLGDKAEIYKTEILKKNKFPEFEDEYFLTEAIVWNKIAFQGYKVRWYNQVIYMCEYLDDGLSKSGSNSLKGYIENYRGFCQYVGDSIKYTYLKNNMHLICDYIKVSKVKKQNFLETSNNIFLTRFELFILIVKMPFFWIINKLKFLTELVK